MRDISQEEPFRGQLNKAMDLGGEKPKQALKDFDDLIKSYPDATKGRAIFYFTVDGEAHVVRVLAVFFGGQDHQRQILKRLGSA